jgi:hypothetical protein
MKTFLLITVLALAPFAQADTKADLLKVQAKATKLASGTDVRWKFSAYENTDNNPCAAEGTSYIAEIFVRKSFMKMKKNGELTQERRFESVNTYGISKDDLAKGGDLSDAHCQE